MNASVCCCHARSRRTRRRRFFRSPGSGAGCPRRPMCMARRGGSLVTSLSTPGLVVTVRSPKRARGCSGDSGITTTEEEEEFHYKNPLTPHAVPLASARQHRGKNSRPSRSRRWRARGLKKHSHDHVHDHNGGSPRATCSRRMPPFIGWTAPPDENDRRKPPTGTEPLAAVIHISTPRDKEFYLGIAGICRGE